MNVIEARDQKPHKPVLRLDGVQVFKVVCTVQKLQIADYFGGV